MWSDILGFLARPVTAWVEGKASRDYMKEEGALIITKSKVALEVAKQTAEAERLLSRDVADADYDRQAQLEKRYTYADELLTICMVLLVGAHFFFPAVLTAGWLAMGYTSAPWWLEFIIVGIFVSVFGLMRLFRAFTPFNKNKEENK
jgi:hypothetical protein